MSQKKTGISIFALVMLITGAVDNIRNLPASALFGTSLIFFFVFAAIVFLIPASLVSAELGSQSAEESGIFHWTRAALGEKMGFMAIWIQWVANLVWFPTILSFLVGTAAYFFSPELAQNKIYLVSTILGSFWLLTLINLKGIHVSATFTSICTMLGMVVPMALLIIMAIIWIALGKPLQLHFTAASLIPKLHDSQNWISLTAIMTAFLGIELSAVHVKDIRNPQHAFPRALFYSILLILGTMILGSLAIGIVLPKDQINLVNGALQTFTTFFAAYHISWLIPILVVLLLLGTSGGVISWVISPTRGVLQAGQLGYLPASLCKLNKHGIAGRLLIGQAILVSLFCAAFLLMPSVNGSYWLLTALSTQLYILMYVIMFIVGIVSRYKRAENKGGFSIPGGKAGIWMACLLGLTGCLITLIVGFIPPDSINVGNFLRYEIIMVSGMLVMLLPTVFLYIYKNRNLKSQKQAANLMLSET